MNLLKKNKHILSINSTVKESLERPDHRPP